MAAGADLGIKPFGIRAMDCLRIEKSYRLPGRELSIEYAALESGLDRFVHLDKGDFLGRDALAAWKDRGIKWAFTTLEVHDTTDADALGSNPITLNGDVVGRCTSGNYGFRLEKSLALAMIRPDLTKPGTELEIEILGNVHRCTVVEESPFDPDNTRLRADG
ncbi:MAG TPA: dimethylglycine dehydrogenase, partial [Rhodospirillaceae bacterium]|nr:dimethylglycine dehydrogenase [Rhodospirillaceae bacterium]